ncbi:HEAT repeat [Fodinibius roseus]|uniref:HEAT repeat n=1 Tax=Fodinibius roseus TaxID=1194090 RepID=A0A1M4V764_9BACT|nr:family 16 glycoside hydrolase [Fodinibius roseus]SHE64762.1 HEAT repeat [Fodinibius roseus]
MRFRHFTLVAFALVLVSCSSTREMPQQQQTYEPASSTAKVTSRITDLPAVDQAEREWIFSELVAAGPSGINALTEMLVAPGSGDDTQARFAVNGISKYVSRAGAESERAMVEKVLIDELQSHRHPLVKVFLMEQLELIGSNESIPALQSFIGDDRLNESAVHALRAINTNRARQVLAEGISATEGEKRIAVIKALGDMKASDVTGSLLPLATSDDPMTRKVVLYALARSGEPEAGEVLSSALDTGEGYQQEAARRYYLLYAGRLAEEGNTSQSADISRNILSGDFSSEARSSALSILVGHEGEEALDDLVEAAESSDARLRSTALSLLGQHAGWQVPERWTTASALDELSPAVQADIIDMLGRSGRASVSTLRPFLESNELSVRIAAARATAAAGGEEALPVLLEALTEAEQPEEIAALKNALLRLPTESLVSEAADLLPSPSGSARIALIEILAERRADQHLDTVLDQLDGSDAPVRLAVFQSLRGLADPDDLPQLARLLSEAQNENERSALQEAVLAVSEEIPEPEKRARAVLQALEEAPNRQKPYLLELLPEMGGEKALEAVVAASRSSNDSIQQAALRALSDWPDALALSPLAEAFQNAPESGRSDILEGYIRLVQQSKYSAADKVQFLKDMLDESTSGEEKLRVLSGFAALESPEALRAVAAHFNDENVAVRERSLRSVAQILSASTEDTGRELALIAATTSPEHKEKIEQYIQELESAGDETDIFTTLFNGEDLTGWVGDMESYAVSNGQIISKDGATGNLFTEDEYSNFILKFDFKLTAGANNGLAIRAPLDSHPAYEAMELQIIDNTAEKYKDLEPYQFHGSIYGVAPAQRGHLNPVGEWNTQEVIADGSHITVRVNGQTITDVDLADIDTSNTMDGRDHPGLLNESGHIGFLGHGDEVAFRDIRIQDLDVYYPDYSSDSGNGDGMNEPPEGFKALFNGENLEGWKGVVGNPKTRAEMTEEELAQKQKEANTEMREHWSVRDGVLSFDGEGHSVATDKKYRDFEMMLDWKIEPGGDSGVYLRETPQVQIWDITEWPQGSGGLYNNKEHPSKPLVPADNAIGEWNNMHIRMVGEKVTVHLNSELVVDNVVLENFWDRDEPVYSEGAIDLQAHNTPLYFKNIFIREIPRKVSLFNGENLSGWERVGEDTGQWHADDGLLYTEGGGGWLSTTETYDNFKLEFEYRLPEGGNSGVFLRAPREGNPAYEGMEIQLLDDNAEQYADLQPWQYTGSIYDVKAPSGEASKKAGEWQKMEITADGSEVKVRLNGETVVSTDLVNYMDRVEEHPGLKRRSGYIGLQNHNSRVEFRNINITEIK